VDGLGFAEDFSQLRGSLKQAIQEPLCLYLDRSDVGADFFERA